MTVTSAIESLDIVAAWMDDRKTQTVGIINPTKQKYEITMELNGAKLTGGGQLWQIADSDLMAYNECGKKATADD